MSQSINRKIIRQCLRCRDYFHPWNGSPAKYCSHSCRSKDLLVNRSKNKKEPWEALRECAWCAGLFTVKGRTEKSKYSKKYCSLYCRAKHEKELDRKIPRGICRECNNPMEKSRCWVCGPCKEKKSFNSRKKCKRKRRYRLRTNGKVVDFENEKIYQRDRWICHICGKMISKSKRHPHPLSATIDHLNPISKQGWHAPWNVKAAHFVCNSKRGNKDLEQYQVDLEEIINKQLMTSGGAL